MTQMAQMTVNRDPSGVAHPRPAQCPGQFSSFRQFHLRHLRITELRVLDSQLGHVEEGLRVAWVHPYPEISARDRWNLRMVSSKSV
jgi:hypothetical protein